MTKVLQKIEQMLWRTSVIYPDHFDKRLAEYAKSTDEISNIEWQWLRYQADPVTVDLASQVEQDATRRMAQEISHLMDDGHVKISFRYMGEVVATYVMVNGLSNR